jgi:hypothetical protein
LELTLENIDKMSFRAITNLLCKESGIKPGLTPYAEALWPDIPQMEGSQEFIDMRLWEAALRGNHSLMADLVARGADVHARDGSRQGWTALHFAAAGADQLFVGCDDLVQARTVRKLVELGADVNCSTERGWTPLHSAATRGHTCTVIRLGALGANLEARDSYGRTPLHMAARWGWRETAEALLSLGANACGPDSDGRTPAEHAWFYKGKYGGGDFEGTIAVLQAAAAEVGLSSPAKSGAGASGDAAGDVEVRRTRGHELEEERIEEGPSPADLDEQAGWEGSTAHEHGDSGQPSLQDMPGDFAPGAEGKPEGEELSPYDIPRSTQTIPWWDTAAWQNRAELLKGAPLPSPGSSAAPADQGGPGAARGANEVSRLGAAASGDSQTSRAGEELRRGEVGVLSAEADKDEWGNVLLSKSRASFPKSRKKKRALGAGEGEGGKAGPLARETARGQQHVGALDGPPSGRHDQGLKAGFLESLAAVEMLDLAAKRRLMKFQQRMTPRGFKGGSILKDHIDFGGGKGADKEGHR